MSRALPLSGFASLVSSLAAAAVSRPVVPVSRVAPQPGSPRALGFVASDPVVPAWVARVPRRCVSAPVSLAGAVVFVRGDSVCVSVGGVVRECRVSYLPRAGLPALTPAAVLEAVSRRIARGESVRFVAAFGYSPDRWFCGLFPA